MESLGAVVAIVAILAIVRFVVSQGPSSGQTTAHPRQAEVTKFEADYNSAMAQFRTVNADPEGGWRGYETSRREAAKRLRAVDDDALAVFESAPDHLRAAEEAAREASRRFEIRAFAPFWDSIEAGYRALAEVESGMGLLSELAHKHMNTVGELERLTVYLRQARSSEPTLDTGLLTSKFPVSASDVHALGETSDVVVGYLDEVVRRSQRDFEFASIYEHRRTNQLLLAGFLTLNDAIDHLGHRVETSVEGLRMALRELHPESSPVVGKALGALKRIEEYVHDAAWRGELAVSELRAIRTRLEG